MAKVRVVFRGFPDGEGTGRLTTAFNADIIVTEKDRHGKERDKVVHQYRNWQPGEVREVEAEEAASLIERYPPTPILEHDDKLKRLVERGKRPAAFERA